jgi:hypothetical protein
MQASQTSNAVAHETHDTGAHTAATTFARRVFTFAGVYGLIVIVPLYFMERSIERLAPPAITHPEFYYGFAGVTVAWQLAFLVIGRDPLRYRALMPVAVVEKASFVIAVAALLAAGRIAPIAGSGALGDLILGVLFMIAYRRTRAESR